MIFIEVVQDTGGSRTGHKMKDYLTAFTYYFIYGYKIIMNDTWNFNNNPHNHNNHCYMFNLVDENIFVKRPKKRIPIYYRLKCWSGMEYIKFKEINDNAIKEQKNNPDFDIIIKFCNSTRVQLSDIYNWENKNLIKSGTYNNIKKYLIKRYFLRNLPNNYTYKKDELIISIHIRKGDVFHRELHKSVQYYENIINILKKINKKKIINIYSETWEGYDGKDLFNIKRLENQNTQINIIFKLCLYEYFTEILFSNIFVSTLGQGGFSDLLIQYMDFSKTLIINNNSRHNKFDINFENIFNADDNGNIDIDKLINNKIILN